MIMNKTPFIITIDTEGDNLWANPQKITTRNSNYLHRFQELCEKFGFKPVYLTNWEMANCPVFKEFARDIIKRDTGEIGMHLHAWNSPPIATLTNDDYIYQPFLLEYPLGTMRRKIEVMTKTLEDTFQVSITSHRSGRWAMNNTYFKLLKEFGYKVDCSVTPYVNWGLNDAQYNNNNIDYSDLSSKPYFINSNESSTIDHDILEVPVSIIKNSKFKSFRSLTNRNRFSRRFFNHYNPELLWLRPNGKNLKNMITISREIIENKSDHAEFILHSSELMPGGSPTFRDVKSIEKLYSDMGILFEKMNNLYSGMTLSKFREEYLKTRRDFK
jgi:hypothetical protein